ncbi:MAG: Mrp/NBP35 family ATP-binding protein [Oscillospiraceae bacterium]|nr:Mrp/NBP35 family ATP-binding protein [Oscillospiraceae bacterium]
MSECTHDCSTCSAACSSREPQDLHEKPHELSKIGKVIAVVSGKGGVGKSLVTALTAVSVQRAGHTVGVLDADITGPSVPKMFGVQSRAEADNQGIYPVKTKLGTDIMSLNLLLENPSDPVIWRGPVIAGMVKQFWTDVIWGDDEYLFVDMPPGTGDVPLTVFQSIPVDGILIVTTPQELVSMIVEKAVKMAETMKVPILGLVENMSYAVCPDCGKHIPVFGDSRIDEIAAKHGLPVLGKLPMNPKLAAACDAGMVELYEGEWLEPAVRAILALGGHAE